MVLVDVSQSQCPVSLRGAVNSLSPGFGLSDGVLAAGSRDGLLNRLDWSVSYVDSCFSCLMKPYVLIYLRFSFMDVVEDECNGSVGSRWRACVKECLATLLATLSLHASLCVILAVLRFKSFVGGVAEGSGRKGGRSHGEASRTDGVDDGALCGAEISLVCWADAAGVSGFCE